MILTQTLAAVSLLLVSECTMTNIIKVGEQDIIPATNLLKLSLLQILDKLTRTLWYDKLLLLIRVTNRVGKNSFHLAHLDHFYVGIKFLMNPVVELNMNIHFLDLASILQCQLLLELVQVIHHSVSGGDLLGDKKVGHLAHIAWPNGAPVSVTEVVVEGDGDTLSDHAGDADLAFPVGVVIETLIDRLQKLNIDSLT